MRIIRSGAVALLSVLVLFAAFFVNATTASATSSYDHIVNPLRSLSLVSESDPMGCQRNLSADWDSVARSFMSSTELSSYENRTATLVTARYVNGLPVNVWVSWWTNFVPTATFNANDVRPSREPNYGVSISPTNDCSLHGAVFMYGWMQLFRKPLASATERPFLVEGFNITYPTGYEGKYFPQTYTSTPGYYVALGDSYSSGEGVTPYLPSTDVTGVNECHRSMWAYPDIVSQMRDLGNVRNATCSSATVSDINGTTVNSGAGSWGDSKQLTAVDDLVTEVVTLTIGGNDAGFGDILETCMKSHEIPEEEEGAYEFLTQSDYEKDVCLDKIDHYQGELALGGELQGVYRDILDSAKPNAQLYVLGYPHVFADPSDIPAGCLWTNIPGAPLLGYSTRSVTTDEMDEMREFHDALITQIDDAVQAVDSQTQYSGRIHFVDVTPYFEGHEVCSSDEYIHHVYAEDIDDADVSSFHPNKKGQQAYALALLDEMS